MSVAAPEYPDFARLAQERGVQSTLSLPLIAGDSGLGAMNLYAKTVKGFSDEDEALGSDLAAAAAIVLATPRPIGTHGTSLSSSQRRCRAAP